VVRTTKDAARYGQPFEAVIFGWRFHVVA
jgi:hypothetical protein